MVERVVITADRDGLDPYHFVPDDKWPEAFREYQRIVSSTILEMFPSADVEVREGVALTSVAVVGPACEDFDVKQQISAALGDAAWSWGEWLSAQSWY